jgi:hypothetical protein
MEISEDVIKKFTSKNFENVSYRDVVELIKGDLVKGSSS